MERTKIQRFEIRGILGAGAIGCVYRAYDPQLEREVAVKVLARRTAVPSALSSTRTVNLRDAREQNTDELLSEARVMARLSHQNVLAVYEVGVDVEGAVFLVSELVDGTDLRAWCGTSRSLFEHWEVFVQAARGLAAAHAAGIVHRDLKPDNILIGRDGRVRIADFGLSHLVRQAGEMVRVVAEGGGTPSYMAPELWRGEAATPKSDVYAFGLTVIEALTGERLADGTVASRLRARGVSMEITGVIVACVGDDPQARPTAARVAAILEGRHGRSRAGTIGAFVLLLVAGGGAAAWFGVRDDRAPACTVSPARWAGRWDAGQRAAIVRQLQPAPDESAATVEATAKMFDEQVAAIARETDATCSAGARGEATRDQVLARLACLDRRAFAVGAVARRVLAAKAPRPGIVAEWVGTLATAESCVGATTPPARDPAVQIELYDRFASGQELTGVERVDAMREIAAAAERAGDLELGARATVYQAANRTTDTELSATLLQDVQRVATSIGATEVALTALLARVARAEAAGEYRTAASLAEAARDLAAHQPSPPALQLRTQFELARAATKRNDWTVAHDLIAQARATNATPGHGFADRELKLRRLELAVMEVRREDAVDFARETATFAAGRWGEASAEHAYALDLLAKALQRRGRAREARATRAQIADVFGRITPPPLDTTSYFFRAQIATDLLQDEIDIARAHRELVAVVAAIGDEPRLQAQKLRALQARGIAEQMLGKFEDAARTLDDVIELALVQYGPDHVFTTDARKLVADYALERGDLARAARQLDLVQKIEREKSKDQRKLGSVKTTCLASELARRRGDLRAAERLAREASAIEVEAKAKGKCPSGQLGKALIDARRWRAAVAALDIAIESSKSARGESDLARFRLYRAKAIWELGRRDEARREIADVRDIIARHPEEQAARALLAALTKQVGRRGKR